MADVRGKVDVCGLTDQECTELELLSREFPAWWVRHSVALPVLKWGTPLAGAECVHDAVTEARWVLARSGGAVVS